MQLTLPKLKEILTLATQAAYAAIEARDIKSIVSTAKVGDEAHDHTGSNCNGYFAIEDSILSCIYYDAPSIFHEFIEKVNEGIQQIDRDLFVEPINSVEFAIYK